MIVKRALTAVVPAAALLLAMGAPAAFAESVDPAHAAMLHAATARSGLGPSGYVGVGISGAVPEAPADREIEIAGVQVSSEMEGQTLTHSTLGDSGTAAMLHAATARSAIGPTGQIGEGISGAVPAGTMEVAGVQIGEGAGESYEDRLRHWGSSGFRVTAGHVHLFSLEREDSMMSEAAAEVAGVQLEADGTVDGNGYSYENRLREFTSTGFRITPGWVNTSAIARR